jgi:hypothetical protein
MNTPRQCQHTPRHSATFELGGPLGEPFLTTHRTGLYFNTRAATPAEVLATEGAQLHLPAAYAVVRQLLEQETAQAMWHQLVQPTQVGGVEPAEPVVHTYNKSRAMFQARFPALMSALVGLRDAFGRALNLQTEEISRIAICDTRIVRYTAGMECPWHRDDPRSHFVVAVLLSDPNMDFEGGEMVLHAGDSQCAADSDAMPVRMEQGDAVIYCASRFDHAVQHVVSGERVVCIVELAIEGDEQ